MTNPQSKTTPQIPNNAEVDLGDYFNSSLRAVGRKLGGLKDSLVQSSVWKEPFTKALKQFPDLELNELDYAESICDACRISGRIATVKGTCSGSSYSRTTFEVGTLDLAQTPFNDATYSSQAKSETSDDSDGDEGDEDSEGHSVKEFYLGRFCAARARVFHSFTHWEVRSTSIG